MRPIRVLIVDDAAAVRHVVTQVLAADPAIEVVGTASNGRIALRHVERFAPDVVTLDVEMPEMDGLQTLAVLRKDHPGVRVIMFSTVTERGATATLDALALGASDYVTKPAYVGSMRGAIDEVRASLVPRVRALMGVNDVATDLPTFVAPTGRRSDGPPSMIAIAVSTGGPAALEQILKALPADLAAPIVIVQHMPPLFTRLLAERLNAAVPMQVREGVDGAHLQPGTAWVAPGDRHVIVTGTPPRVRLETTDAAPEQSCRPSANVLFRSVARVYGPRGLGLVLTGMGMDGAEGSVAMHRAGGEVIVQDEGSSVVWGMPRAVIGRGVADAVVPLSEIGRCVGDRVAGRAPTAAAAGTV